MYGTCTPPSSASCSRGVREKGTCTSLEFALDNRTNRRQSGYPTGQPKSMRAHLEDTENLFTELRGETLIPSSCKDPSLSRGASTEVRSCSFFCIVSTENKLYASKRNAFWYSAVRFKVQLWRLSYVRTGQFQLLASTTCIPSLRSIFWIRLLANWRGIRRRGGA